MKAKFNTYPMRNSAILRINEERDVIFTDPEYQRNSDIWNLDKKQLLIDSILNDYDIPKIYFHALTGAQKSIGNKIYDYAIIDGRQRLEAIWGFVDGEFSLADDFVYLKDTSVKPGNLPYAELAKKYPKIKTIFDSFTLPIILIEAEDIDFIEDMFSRLNEAVPLNAAEKRNALGGPMAKMIRIVSNNYFFKKRVNFTNHRYQHREVVARLLFIEYSLDKDGKIVDTKKPYLDNLVKSYKRKKDASAKKIADVVINILNVMKTKFESKDDLLRAQSIVPIYYLLFKEAIQFRKVDNFNRNDLLDFKKKLINNRSIAEQDITKAHFDYLEFDRMSQQGTNDASSIKERLRIIKEYLDIF